ncbi:hypothetical protein Tco_0830076 [Tanacetum coccineum]
MWLFEGSLEDKILVLKPPRNCLFTNCVENEFFKDFQDTSESSDDNTNVVNAPREPIVVNQDPGENSSPSPLHIDHCCHECGDSLDGIFCRQCTCKSCGKGAHYGYNCPPRIPIISNPEPCKNQTIDEPLQKLAKLASNMSVSIMPTLIDDDILLTIKDDILREKLSNVNLLIAKIDALRDNPTPSSEIISSGSPYHSDLSLPDYKAFYVENSIYFKEKKYFPPADRSDLYHEEFADKLAHIISPPEISRFVKTLVLAVSTRVSHPQLQFGNPEARSSWVGFQLRNHRVFGCEILPRERGLGRCSKLSNNSSFKKLLITTDENVAKVL